MLEQEIADNVRQKYGYVVMYFNKVAEPMNIDFNMMKEFARLAPGTNTRLLPHFSHLPNRPWLPRDAHELFAVPGARFRYYQQPPWVDGDAGAMNIEFTFDALPEVAEYLAQLVLGYGFTFKPFMPVWREPVDPYAPDPYALDESSSGESSSGEAMDINCEMCGQSANRTCSGCYLEHYCSEACQQARRPDHVGDCYISEEGSVTVDGPIDWIKRKWQNWRERRKARRMKKKE
jgi:hypothetical protein